MKFARHTKLLEIISENDIYTQEELANKLQEAGFEVTQATVSRDIKELRLTKMRSKNGGKYKYALPEANQSQISDRLIRIFSDSVLSMDSANNIIVIKTITAGAQGAAAMIDSLNWDEIVGSIAGDDTIMIVIRDNDAVSKVLEKFSKLTQQ